ncbi:sensor histidine kinase [Anaerobacillus sp. CMMVII]|uniref:sensor histidine kinase n=1 Tax=Anaerobacillus sp. CMMVII TaxID=2755588 RepID=UPI0021B75BAB|nr:sensor histidine kinase [Anaerobacillus sp. CMMVII]MCT8140407.1 sensor histidine kinase [Anaerobacillus sp. CMMVII]
MEKRDRKLSGIQWQFLKNQWRIVMLSSIIFSLGILGLATIIQYSPRLTKLLPNENMLFTNAFFMYLLLATLYVFLINVVVSFLYSYPFAKYVKNQTEKLIDAANSFTRGKLASRVHIQGENEFSELSLRFNAMAEHYEKQVYTLQKLLSENSILIEQAEQAASLDERRKLARDLHDAISQQLFAISMTMAALPKLIIKNQQQAMVVLGDVEKMVNNAQQELRALIMHLRPVTLDGKSFEEGMKALFEELKVKNKHLTLQLNFSQIGALPSKIEDQLFRIIQEAISNMLRHSKASIFRMEIYEKGERLFIILEDNGVGFVVENVENKGSYGLLTMKERMIELGGNLTILSYPNKGTKLELRVPLRLNLEKKEENS